MDWTNRFQSPAEAKDFSSSLCIQIGSGTYPAAIQWAPKVLYPGLKHAWGVTGHSFISSAKVENEYKLYLLSPQTPPLHVVGQFYLILQFYLMSWFHILLLFVCFFIEFCSAVSWCVYFRYLMLFCLSPFTFNACFTCHFNHADFMSVALEGSLICILFCRKQLRKICLSFHVQKMASLFRVLCMV
jgi:hypothetical protein